LAGGDARALRAAGVATVLGGVATLYCTGWIYRSLKTIPAWHNGYVVPGYLLLALATGALWFWLVGALGGVAHARGLARGSPPSWSRARRCTRRCTGARCRA
jgi:DMSO reductase anchor subunit